MKVAVLINPGGRSVRAKAHRVDALNCPGRRMAEETYGDHYEDVDIERLPDDMQLCQFESCFAGVPNVKVLRTRLQITEPRLLELIAWVDNARLVHGREFDVRKIRRIDERWRELEEEGVLDRDE